MSSTEIVEIDQARHALEQASTVVEALDVREQAGTFLAWAKLAKLGLEAQNKAAAWKLRAERKAGELLASADLAKNQYDGCDSLSQANIERHDSSRWQKLARVPEADFETYLANATAAGVEITQAAALRLLPKPDAANTTEGQPAARFATAILKRSEADLGILDLPESDIPNGSVVRFVALATLADTIQVGDRRYYMLTPTETAVTAWYSRETGMMYHEREMRPLTSPADLEESA
jgi:hypothetical protein